MLSIEVIRRHTKSIIYGFQTCRKEKRKNEKKKCEINHSDILQNINLKN